MSRCAEQLWRFLLLLLVLAFSGASVAEAGTRRVALVIGNSAYSGLTPLNNPGLDAARMAELLAENGFDVHSCDGTRPGCFDLTRDGLETALEDFADAADGADLALLFYAGHGMEVAQGNVLAPVDMKLSCESRRARRLVLLGDVLEAMRGAREKVVILDACRDNPLPNCEAGCPGRHPALRPFRVPGQPVAQL